MTPEPGFSTRALRAQSDELVRKLDVRERAVLVAILRAQGARDRTPEGDVLRVASARPGSPAPSGAAGAYRDLYSPQSRGMGKASGHHTLTENGAKVVASLLGIARSELRYVIRDEEDREQDSYLAHRIGVNEFFCALIEAGRANDGHGLAKWVPERTVRTGDGWIRPDGYGVYLHPNGALDFYLEYDRGTETTRQLANKLAGYIGVARDWTEQSQSTFRACSLSSRITDGSASWRRHSPMPLRASSAPGSSRTCRSTSRTKRC